MVEGLAEFLSLRGADFCAFSTVFDIGSRDGRQSLQLARLFPKARVVAIECNADTLDQCRLNTAKNPRITLVEKAVNAYTGRCRFFPIDPKRTVTTWPDGNPGASSLFLASGDYPVETYVQNEVEVECIRLDDLCDQLEVDRIDLIWMDLQGAELLALHSAGAVLETVRYIYTEVSHRPVYADQCLFDDVDAFLVSRGFRLCTQINRERWQQDAIYENTRQRVGVARPYGKMNTADRLPKPGVPEKSTMVPSADGSTADSNALRLLFASARPFPCEGTISDIRRILKDDIDWAIFARKAIGHGLAGLSGHTLSRVAADLTPGDILDALRAVADETRTNNQMLFDSLTRLLEVLKVQGIEAIPFKGPVLTAQAFGDLGLRPFRDLDILIHDRDLRPAMAALRSIGYERQGEFTQAQFEMIHRLQGQEIIFRRSDGTALEPHTRLTPKTIALDIDYAGLWQRAEPGLCNGHPMLMLAPEDILIVLAIHGGKELWWNMKWACDVAAFISAHPQLDWFAIETRARRQGCLRMVLLALSLARRHFGAEIPDRMQSLESADPAINPLAGRVMDRWLADEVTGPPSNKRLSLDRLRLHDGLVGRAIYAIRTLCLPKPHHVGFVALPPWLNFGYIPLKFAHDIIALPLYRVYEHLLIKDEATKGIAGKQPRGEPLDADALARRAQRLLDANRLTDAIESNARALALDPDNTAALRVQFCSHMLTCDWRKRAEDVRRITDGLRSGVRLIAPVFHRALVDSDAEHAVVTSLWSRGFPQIDALWRGQRYCHDKIRVAYISTDFRDHVVADVLAGCFEHHDKTRFEITAVSLGPNDGSKMRRRVESAFDRFIDVQAMSDGEVATLLRDSEIDIAIDLNGYSGAKRTGILLRRPAPIQVGYLGYPGTMNAPFMDYIIADRWVIPEENQAYYSEKVGYLPHTYFPTDGKRPVTEDTPGRAEAGLPPTGFVFACHNAPHKIAPEIFDVWMRLLREVEGSVLWLKAMNPGAKENLRREAEARGVAAERLVFAPRVQQGADHLARLRLADLCLDTRPYNAHATASDALWAGVPIITCPGSSFPSRVAASLLHAIGLPELVAGSLEEYETLARTLAQGGDQLAVLKTKLWRNRSVEPLFNTAGFTHNLEKALIVMWERQQAGLPPATFSVGG